MLQQAKQHDLQACCMVGYNGNTKADAKANKDQHEGVEARGHKRK